MIPKLCCLELGGVKLCLTMEVTRDIQRATSCISSQPYHCLSRRALSGNQGANGLGCARPSPSRTSATFVMKHALLLVLASALGSLSLAAQDFFDKTQVRSMYFTLSQPSWWSVLLQTGSTHRDIEASLTVDNVVYPRVGIRVKGNTSARATSTKKPFNISLDTYLPAQRLYGLKTVNLNNAYVDPTFTREALTYDVMREYLPTPRTCWVKVYLNGTYWGLYVGAEQINKEFLDRWYEKDTGTRYKGDPPTGAKLNSATLTWSGTGIPYYKTQYEIKTPTHANAWTDLANLIDKLNRTSTLNFKTEIEKVLDVDQALWYMATANVVNNLDSYVSGGHNYYMYFNPIDGRMCMLPWDANMSFGVFGIFGGGGTSAYRLDPFFGGLRNGARPLVSRLLATPEYRQTYIAHMRTILAEMYDWTNVLGPLNTQYQTLIRSDVMADPNKIYFASWFDSNVKSNVRAGNYIVPGIETLTNSRRNYLLGHADIKASHPVISNLQYWPKRPDAGQLLRVTAQVQNSAVGATISQVRLRATTVGAFTDYPMFDDGMHYDGAAGDGVYGGSFSAVTASTKYKFYISATNSGGRIGLHPERAERVFHEVTTWNGMPSGPVVLNEFVADNETGDVDPSGEADDWIELHNRAISPKDLTGTYLSDDPKDPKKWALPAGTIIPAGGFLRVWCDNQVAQGPLHANFKLSKAGETVGFYDTDLNQNAVLDLVTFAQQKADRAFGRVPDGGGQWYFVWEPSGGAGMFTSRDAVRYDHRRKASKNNFDLTFQGSTMAGTQAVFDLSGGIPNGVAGFVMSAAPGYFDLGAFGPLALSPSSLVLAPAALDPLGKFTWNVTVPSGLQNVSLYFQAVSQDLSNAMVVRFR